ncbi:response regulator transcription factor [Ohtaekwangia sp.]|uniref:response regulator transcription factor n=1 Tax=Ohtaekwangia sp. TaxID=2066019 RepID=UPI002F93336A
MVKVIVVDNHALYRIGLVTLLKSDPRFVVVGEYKSFQAIKPHISTLNADLVFIDISLNRQSGLDIAAYIKNNTPSIKVIILTALNEECYILSAVEADVDGYIHKDSEPSELLMGIGRILEGEKFYSLDISNRLISNLHKKNFRGLPFLTAKEKEVIRYLMEGNSTRRIAELMEISPRTVDTHRANILGKFNLKNTNELISKIAKQKIRI